MLPLDAVLSELCTTLEVVRDRLKNVEGEMAVHAYKLYCSASSKLHTVRFLLLDAGHAFPDVSPLVVETEFE